MGGLDLISSLLKIIAVFALLYLTLRGLARHQRGRQGGRVNGPTAVAPLIEIVDQTRLGRNANLAAVRVGERILLIGVTESALETLADVTEDIDLTVEAPDEPDQTSVLDHALDVFRSGSFRR